MCCLELNRKDGVIPSIWLSTYRNAIASEVDPSSATASASDCALLSEFDIGRQFMQDPAASTIDIWLTIAVYCMLTYSMNEM